MGNRTVRLVEGLAVLTKLIRIRVGRAVGGEELFAHRLKLILLARSIGTVGIVL